MFYYDRTDVSEGIYVNKKSASKVCDVCQYWYFLIYSFRFQSNLFNRCHYLTIISINLSDIAVLNIKGPDYWWIISLINKNNVMNVIQKSDLTWKKEEH